MIKITTKILPKELNPNHYLNIEIPGIEILITVIFITLIGWLSLSFIGKKLIDLINKILTKIPSEDILWEAPKKPQQVWFVKLLGANVNLGNIAWDEIIPLETLRIGLRGDTFNTFLKN